MSIAHPNIVNWMQGGMQGPRPTYQGGMSGGGVGWGQTGASPSWPGANPNPPMSGGSGNYNMGPSFNPQSMLERMKQGMINRRPQPNQNPYSNPTPGQNPIMGGVGRASGINFGPSNPQDFLKRMGPISMDRPMPSTGRPTPDAQGYYGGWQTEGGLNQAGNQPGMSYLM